MEFRVVNEKPITLVNVLIYHKIYFYDLISITITVHGFDWYAIL